MTPVDPRHIPRLTTGVPGLDLLLEGGLPRGGVFLVQGVPGAGKTVMANQMCFHHARKGEKAVFLTLIAESHVRMFAHLRRFDFFDEDEIGRGVHYHAGFGVLAEKGLDGLAELTRDAVLQSGATLFVVDGMLTAGALAPSETEFKLLLHSMQTIAVSLGCTIILLSSAREGERARPEHTMVDGVIELASQLNGLRARRHLEVLKMRGVAPVTGCHSVEISDVGILVRPRLESRTRPVDEGAGPGAEPGLSMARVPFGIATLDAMIRGGLPVGSNTMLAGPTGAGKTILGLQYIAGGVATGESGLYVGFYERPSVIVAKSNRIGLRMEEGMKAGLVDVVWERPIEGVLDAVADRLLERIAKTGAKRLCLDGLTALKRTVDRPDRINDATAALSEELERLKVTTVFTLETPELFGPTFRLPIEDVSAVTQNMILMRHVEVDARLHRLISIVKMRDSGYDSRICEFKITENGIALADTFASAEALLSGSAVTSGRARRPKPSPTRKARKR